MDTASTTEDRWIKADIISTGSVGKSDFGLEDGQTVLYDKHAGQPLTIEGEKYHMIKATDVALVL
jgi:co-chaperonin GroES (HSP10)